MADSIMTEMLLALGLLGGLVLATELGFRLGLRRRQADGAAGEFPLATVQGATLGLVGLWLGFSYAAAGSRFADRQDVIVAEANAIGTAYLRAELLAEPRRSEYRRGLRDYVETRIALFTDYRPGADQELRRRSEQLQARLWRLAVAGVQEAAAYDETVLPPLNDVIDLHAERLAKMSRHNPPMVVEVLLISTAVTLLAWGFGCGLQGRRFPVMTGALAVLFALALWLVVDLDYPRRGLVQINQQPMLDLRASLQAAP